MVILALDKDDQNEALVDPWSAVHATSGLALGLTDVSFFASITAAILFDVFEHLFERSKYGQRFFNTSGPESWGNVITDLVLFSGGWWLGNRYNQTGKPSRVRNFGRLTRGRRPRRSVRGQRVRRGSPRVSRADAMAGSIVP